MTGEVLGNRSNDAGIEEHARLGRRWRQFPHERFQLTLHKRLRHRVHTGDSGRCLGRQTRDRRGAMDTQSRKHLQIGLDTGPAPTVGPGDGQCDRPKHASILHARNSGILGSPCKVRRSVDMASPSGPLIDDLGWMRAERCL